MKTILLIAIAAFLVLITWSWRLDFDSNEVMVDGVTTSAIIVFALAVALSLASWMALSATFRHITTRGVVLSIITGAATVIPFMDILGPVAGMVVGAVAGFVAFLFQKTMANPRKGKPLATAAATLTAVYLVLIAAFFAAQSGTVWDTGDGIGAWSGTPDGMVSWEPTDFFRNDNRLVLFLAAILSLTATALVVRSGGQ